MLPVQDSLASAEASANTGVLHASYILDLMSGYTHTGKTIGTFL
jgi:hypothetical protein